MYPVSIEYQDKIKENNRTFRSTIQIQHSTGVLDLTDKDIVSGSIIYTESSQAGEEFTIGGTVASDISFVILNKPEYANIDFTGATVIPTIGLLLAESYDTENYFLSAPYPTEFQESEGLEQWEDVPLGIFNIDDVNKSRNTIRIKAIDNMINLDKPYNLSNISYPTTLYQVYTNICNVCDIQIGTTDFVNKDYLINSHPGEDLTFRDVLGYVAELSGCFAKMNRTGALELRWYEPSGLTLTPANRFNFIPREDLVQIKGIMTTIDGTTYLAGVIDYAIDLTGNPLLQDGYETALSNLFNAVKDTIFTPYESSWQGNPAIQAGDIITQIDRDGNIFNTLITSSTYKYRGASSLSARGLPLKAKGYKGSTNRKIAEIKRKVEKDIGDAFTTLEQAQLNATELMANMLGGYIIKDIENGILYIADNPDINLAMKVWKWGLGGFGYSSSGKDGLYNTAITADGSIVAMLISANIITADMVQTGILQSEDGSTWVNLDNGEFNFKEVLKYIDGTVSVGSTIATKDDIENNRVYFEYSVDNIIWKAIFENGDRYMRQKIGLNGVWSEGVLIKGADGYTPIKGTDYFDGINGQNGTSSYIWVKYSASADGTNFGDTLNTYMGVATTTTSTAPTLKTAYKWSKAIATDGVKGETGSNGQTSYLHIKYSDNGTSFTANVGETVGAWIGTYVDFIQADSTTFSAYTWNKIKGADGITPDTSQFAPRVFGNGLMEISDTKGFIAYKDATKQEYTQHYPGGLYRVSNNGATMRSYFFERHAQLVGDYTQIVYSYEPAEDPSDTRPTDIQAEINLEPHPVIQLPLDFIGKDFRIIAQAWMGDGVFIEKYTNRYFDPMGTGNLYLKIQDMNGNVWDGLTKSTMPALIKSTGKFKVIAWFADNYYYKNSTYGYVEEYVKVISKFKVLIDVIA